VSAPTQEEIRLAAYFLWEKAGRPVNDGVRHWLEAERYLRWLDDRGQFLSLILTRGDDGRIGAAVGEVVWRRGRWEKVFDKATGKEGATFTFHGPGYRDYKCTSLDCAEEDFGGYR
jgi:hypothetical protein